MPVYVLSGSAFVLCAARAGVCVRGVCCVVSVVLVVWCPMCLSGGVRGVCRAVSEVFVVWCFLFCALSVVFVFGVLSVCILGLVARCVSLGVR